MTQKHTESDVWLVQLLFCLVEWIYFYRSVILIQFKYIAVGSVSHKWVISINRTVWLRQYEVAHGVSFSLVCFGQNKKKLYIHNSHTDTLIYMHHAYYSNCYTIHEKRQNCYKRPTLCQSIASLIDICTVNLAVPLLDECEWTEEAKIYLPRRVFSIFYGKHLFLIFAKVKYQQNESSSRPRWW